jgi:hypothetical protein
MSSIPSGRLAELTRAVIVALAVSSTLSLMACDDDDVIAPTPLEGVYVLTSINGFPVPFTVPGTTDNVVVESGDITITSNGSYDGSIEGETNGTPEVLFADAGTTSETGTTVTFTSTAAVGLTYSGTRNGDILTIAIRGADVGVSGVQTITLAFEK